MISKYAGRCTVCARSFPAGTEIHYDAASRTAMHAACRPRSNGAATAAPAAPVTRTLDRDGWITTPYDPSSLPLLRALPGARWDPASKRWRCSVAPADLPRVIEVADQIGLIVDPALRASIIATPQAVAAATVDGLYPYQVAGVDFLARHDRALLLDEMGLGKTIQVLAALPRDASARVVVICPATLKGNWAREATRWAPAYTARIVNGRNADLSGNPGEIVIANYECLGDGSASQCVGATVIVDEAHYCKSYKAKRSKAVEAISAVAGKLWALTGTPLTNRPTDLWGVLSSTGMARTVFGSWGRFLALFGGQKSIWGGYEWASTAAPEAGERLKRVSLRRLRADVLPDLPAKTWRDIEVPAGKHTAAMLDDLDLDDLSKEGLPPFERFSAIRATLAVERVDAMLEIVAEYEEENVPLVVFSAHRAPIDALATRVGWVVITGDTPVASRAGIVERFQSGEYKGIALTIAAGGVGITLTRASHALFVDLDWTPANNAQAEDRLVRIGQKASAVLITRLVSDHVLDQHVHALLGAKIALAASVVDPTAIVVAQPVIVPVSSEKNDAPVAAESSLTAEQISAVHDKLRRLAAACDGAHSKDGAGFNRNDTTIGKSLAACASLTIGQAKLGERIVKKYQRQLS